MPEYTREYFERERAAHYEELRRRRRHPDTHLERRLVRRHPSHIGRFKFGIASTISALLARETS